MSNGNRACQFDGLQKSADRSIFIGHEMMGFRVALLAVRDLRPMQVCCVPAVDAVMSVETQPVISKWLEYLVTRFYSGRSRDFTPRSARSPRDCGLYLFSCKSRTILSFFFYSKNTWQFLACPFASKYRQMF